MDTNVFTKIPPELLSHILEDTTLLDPDSPLLLSFVCRYFHRVIIASPRVWRQLHITVSEATDASAIRKAQLWFSRSGKCDIALVLSGSTDNTLAEEPIQLLSRRGKALTWEGRLELPRVIRSEAERLSSLTLRFPTEAQVRYFLTSIYPSALYGHPGVHMDVDSTYSLLSDVDVALPAPVNQLNVLNIDILSPPPPRPLSHQNPPVDLAPLPHLVHMQLNNCTMALLSLPLFAHLRYLVIHNPLRAQPVLLNELLRVLGATEGLRVLDLEARISVSLSPAPSLLPSSSDLPLNDELLLLPHLTHLSLRANNLPAALDSMILPSLHTLSIDDLDGNRPEAAWETGEVMKKLLVRMDMPSFSKVVSATGLRDLAVRGVSFPPLLVVHWVPVWEWCLRRMRVVKRVEVPWIIGDLMAAASSPASIAAEGGRDVNVDGMVEKDEERGMEMEVPCAGLEEVLMLRCPADVVRRFKMLRPGVEVLLG